MLLWILFSTAVAATEPSASELLRRGDAALVDLEYELAAEELMRAASAADATEDQRIEAHLKAGIANRIIGRDVDARLNFRTVLLARPETRLPEGTSPKVLSFFESVRREVALERERDTPASAPPPPDAKADPLSPFSRALVTAGVTAGVGVLALPACGLCGGGLCIVFPGACFVACGAIGGGLVGALVGRESILDNLASTAAAAGAALVAAGVIGGATYGLQLLLSPASAGTLGNGNLNALADVSGFAGGVVAAVLAGAAAGAVTYLLIPQAAQADDAKTAEPKPAESATPTAY